MADAADDLLEREVELSADRTLYIAGEANMPLP